MKKTHIRFVEFDDVDFNKLVNVRYFGEGNSKDRVLECDFEYCLNCNLRLLNSEPIMTQGILEEELEVLVTHARSGNHVSSKETTVQHSEFEPLQRLIQRALEFGKLKKTENDSQAEKDH